MDEQQPTDNHAEDSSTVSPPAGATQPEGDRLPPDTLRDHAYDHAFGREYASLPHHPIHMVEWFLALPPFAGLIDIIRTVRWRKKNPFTRLMWRALWGRRPLLKLTLTVFVLSIASQGPINLVYWASRWVPRSLPTPSLWLNYMYGRLLPVFLGDPVLYLGALLAWKIRRFAKKPGFDSDIEAVPNWRPFAFRAVGVQVCAAALLTTFVGPVGSRVGYMAIYASRDLLLPSVTPAFDYLHYTLAFAGRWVKFLTSTDWLWNCESHWLKIALLLAVLLKAKTIPRMIGGILAVSYSLEFFDGTLHWAANAGWIRHEVVVSLVAYLLIAGWLWHLAYRRFCRSTDVPHDGTLTPKIKNPDP